MLRVRTDLCRGCGICVESCTQQAISVFSGMAYIIQKRCNQRRRCVEVCPQGADMEIVPVSGHELKANIIGLKDKTEDIVARIENLMDRKRQI